MKSIKLSIDLSPLDLGQLLNGQVVTYNEDKIEIKIRLLNK